MEPAAVVVNHIANKQIENKRKRRQQQELEYQRTLLEQQEPVKPVELPPTKPVKKPTEQKPTPVFEPEIAPPPPPVKKPVAEEPIQQPVRSGTPSKAAGMMSTIDLDIESPLFADSHSTPAPAVPVTVSAEFDDSLEDDQ